VTLPGAALNELIAVLALLPPDAGDDTDAYNAGLLQVLNQSGYVPDEDDKKVLKSYARAVTEPARIGSFERKWLPGELVGVATANRAKWGLDEKKDEKKAAKQGEILVYISDASGTPKSKAYEQVGKSSSVYGHAEQCALDDASGSNIYLVQNAWPCSKCLEYFRRRRDIAAKTVTIFVTHDKGSYSLDNGKTAGATGTLVITNNVISYS
jgi:hypothetical protein